jgi:hypothetical protein
VQEALLAAVKSSDQRLAFEAARSLLALGFRGDVQRLHQVFFGHLVGSQNDELLADILTAVTQACAEDDGERQLAASLASEMDLLTNRIKVADRKRVAAVSTLKKRLADQIVRLKATIAAKEPALTAARARIGLISGQYHVLCAGVKSVLRRTTGKLRLQAAVCLAQISPVGRPYSRCVRLVSMRCVGLKQSLPCAADTHLSLQPLTFPWNPVPPF